MLYNKKFKKLHIKIYQAIEALIIRDNLHFYADFLQNIRIFEDNTKPTAYVTLKNAHIVMGYNSNFIDTLNVEEVKFLLIHELYHVNFNHLHRSIYKEDKELCNVAQDMIINTLIVRHHNAVMFMPKGGLTMPPEYEGEHIFEPLYVWLSQKRDEYNQWKDRNKNLFQQPQGGQGNEEQQSGGSGGNSQSDQEQQSGGGSGNKREQGENKKDSEGSGSGNSKPDNPKDPCPASDQLRDIFDGAEKGEQLTLDIHEMNDLDSDQLDVMDQAIKDLKTKSKLRGNMQGNVEDILDLNLRKPKKNNLRHIKTKVAAMFKGHIKNNTYKKYNKKLTFNPELTFKGYEKLGNVLNVILDTSGSMGSDFEDVLTQIFTNDYKMQIIECDTKVQKVIPIVSKKQLNRLAIAGLGGTVIQPAIDYVTDPANKINRFPTVILTDGYTDTLDVDKMVEVMVLTTGSECPIKGGKKIKQIKIVNEKGY